MVKILKRSFKTGHERNPEVYFTELKPENGKEILENNKGNTRY